MNMYVKLKRYYKILSKFINKEILDKISRCNKTIILKTRKIDNHIAIGILEVIEDVILD